MSLLVFLKQFPDDDARWRHLEAVRWPGGPVCPKCGHVGTTSSVGRAHYHGCRECGSKFTVAFGTALETQDLENRITTDLNLIASAPATVETRLQQLGSDADKLRTETVKMRAALAQENALGGTQSGQGGQISAEIQQANMAEADAIMRIHDHLTGIEESGLPALLDHVKANDVTCEGLNATESARGAFNGPEAELDNCIELETATPALGSVPIASTR